MLFCYMAMSVRIKRSLGAFVYDLFIGRIGTTSMSIRFLLLRLSPRAPLYALTHSPTHSLTLDCSLLDYLSVVWVG